MSKVKLLVVEDESIVAMDIKHRAENLGYEVIAITPKGEEAVELTRKNHVDLILMDIVLKGEMDGVEAAQRIHAEQDTPILYLTAYSDEETLKRAKITEPFGYIIKPFEDRELHSAIEIALYKNQVERRLKESEKWLSTTLESIGDAVIATGKDGEILFMNPVARKVTGWSQEEALGKNLQDVFRLINEDNGLPVEDLVAKILEKDVVIELEDPTLLITKNGNTLPIDDSTAPIRDENGHIIGVALVFRDITQRRKAEKEKEELLKEKARGELSSFVLSALPVFASNIPPQIRNNIAKSFTDRFEENVHDQFQEYMADHFKEEDTGKIFNHYLSWLSAYLSNLGIETRRDSDEGHEYFKFLNCPWVEAESSPMFCLICRAIVIRSFTWTNIEGSVEQNQCIAENAPCCRFEFMLNK